MGRQPTRFAHSSKPGTSGSPGSRLPDTASIFMPWPSIATTTPTSFGRSARDEPACWSAAANCLQLIAIDAKALAYPYLLVHVYNQLGILRLDARNRAAAIHSARPWKSARSCTLPSPRFLSTSSSWPSAMRPGRGRPRGAAAYPGQDHYRQSLAIRENLVTKHAALTDVIARRPRRAAICGRGARAGKLRRRSSCSSKPATTAPGPSSQRARLAARSVEGEA